MSDDQNLVYIGSSEMIPPRPADYILIGLEDSSPLSDRCGRRNCLKQVANRYHSDSIDHLYVTDPVSLHSSSKISPPLLRPVV